MTKDIYRLARSRENRARDLGNIRCIRNEDNKMLIKNNKKINERLKNYFNKFFSDNGEKE